MQFTACAAMGQPRHNPLNGHFPAKLRRPHLYSVASNEYLPLGPAAPGPGPCPLLGLGNHRGCLAIIARFRSYAVRRRVRPQVRSCIIDCCGGSSHFPLAILLIRPSKQACWKSSFQILIGGSSRLTFASALRARQWTPVPSVISNNGPERNPVEGR